MTQSPVSLPDSGVMNEKNELTYSVAQRGATATAAGQAGRPAASFGFAAFAATADSPRKKTKCLRQQC